VPPHPCGLSVAIPTRTERIKNWKLKIKNWGRMENEKREVSMSKRVVRKVMRYEI
jgi:hypothetical protein